MAKKRITIRGLKELLTDPKFSGLPKDIIVCRAEPIEVVKAETPEAASLVRTFVASTGGADREGDKIAVGGWELDNYRKGGSVLYGHDSYSTPAHVVGKPLATWIEGDALKNRIEFTPKEINPTGHMVYQLVAGGFLRSSSVGFLPKEWKEVSDRPGFMPVDFMRQELLEHSIVPVPANPEALDEAKALGIDLAPMVSWAEKMLDEKAELLFVTRDLVEGSWKIAKKAVSVQVPAAVEPAVAPLVATPVTVSATPAKNVDGTGDPLPNPIPPEPTPTPEPDIVSCVEMANQAMAKAVGQVGALADKLVASVKSLQGAMGKAGRVLSTSNEDKLRQARDLLSAVIVQVEAPEEPPKAQPIPEKKSNGGMDLSDPVLLKAVGELVGDLFDSKLKRLRGEPED